MQESDLIGNDLTRLGASCTIRSSRRELHVEANRMGRHVDAPILMAVTAPRQHTVVVPIAIVLPLVVLAMAIIASTIRAAENHAHPNVVLIVADDLAATALSCYGNNRCRTPNIDRLAAQGLQFTRAYCNATYCGPSRASFLSGYYPHATGVLDYSSPRAAIGDRATWPQYFLQHGYRTARIGKIFHMGVPGDIERGTDGADDVVSWSERHNNPGPEWQAPGVGETLESNPDGRKPVMGGNTFVVVEADGDDMVHADGRTARRAVTFIEQAHDRPFFLAVGFVRPHVPFVAPRKYFVDYTPAATLALPPFPADDWIDIPKAGINYKTNVNMQMDQGQQQRALRGYYAAVAYLDAQVGKVLDALDRSGRADDTIVIFTSDHGFHLGEHGFWAKVSLHEESVRVPLVMRIPGRQPARCSTIVELIDLFPTTTRLCGLEALTRLQGMDVSTVFDTDSASVRDAAFCVAPSSQGFMLRSDEWAYLQYGEDASDGRELYDMRTDPQQFTNLADRPGSRDIVVRFQTMLQERLTTIRHSDLQTRSDSPPTDERDERVREQRTCDPVPRIGQARHQ